MKSPKHFSILCLFVAFSAQAEDHAHDHQQLAEGLYKKNPVTFSAYAALAESQSAPNAKVEDVVGFSANLVKEKPNEISAAVLVASTPKSIVKQNYDCHVHLEDAHCKKMASSDAVDFASPVGSFTLEQYQLALNAALEVSAKIKRLDGNLIDVKSFNFVVVNRVNHNGEAGLKVELEWSLDSGVYFYCHLHHGKAMDCHRERK